MVSEEMQLTALLIVLAIGVIIASITMVLSFVKDNRICCLGGGFAFGLLSSALGFLIWTVIEVTSGEFEEIFTLISILILFVMTAFVSVFTLLSTIKKKEFCCLGGGIAFTGIGFGIGLIFSVLDRIVGDIGEVFFFLLIILFFVVLTVALLVTVISLKKRQDLCCFAGVLAIAGVALGIISIILVDNEEFIAGLVSLINPIVLFVVLGVLLFFVKNNNKSN
ncbi:hypothetical protein WAK64_08805 [Bacillus spongiae]|uniref:DUF4203 domain-containing protein n=1 Tax=Bacillus spongiae TaxID=2683610 RepID=A0ABU8HD79_9BACI